MASEHPAGVGAWCRYVIPQLCTLCWVIEFILPLAGDCLWQTWCWWQVVSYQWRHAVMTVPVSILWLLHCYGHLFPPTTECQETNCTNERVATTRPVEEGHQWMHSSLHKPPQVTDNQYCNDIEVLWAYMYWLHFGVSTMYVWTPCVHVRSLIGRIVAPSNSSQYRRYGGKFSTHCHTVEKLCFSFHHIPAVNIHHIPAVNIHPLG